MCNAKTRHSAFEVVLLLLSVSAVMPGVFGLLNAIEFEKRKYDVCA